MMSRRSNHLIALLLAFFVSLPLFSRAQAQDNSTPASEIVYRASLGRAEDVKLLITQGASPDQKNGNGVPILAVAAQRIDAEGGNVVKTLLEMGAKVNARDGKGQTALFYAAQVGNVEAAQALLEGGIDVYALDGNGDIARTIATKTAHHEIIAVLNKFRDNPPPPKRSKPAVESPPAPQESIPAPQESPKTPPESPPSESLASPAESPAAAVAPEAKDKDVQAMHDEMAKEEAAMNTESPAKPAVASELTPLKSIKKMEITVRESPAQAVVESPAEEPIDKFLLGDTTEEVLDEDALARKLEQDKQADVATRQLSEGLTKKRMEEVSGHAYDIAYHTCSFQYWAFVEQVKLKTELLSEELTIAIQSHREQVETIQKKLIYDYKITGRAVDKVTSAAQVKIYTQLNGMRNNRVRRENGVGKMDDMQNRCEEIARQWGNAPALYRGRAETAPVPAARGGAAGISVPRSSLAVPRKSNAGAAASDASSRFSDTPRR